MIHPDPTLTEVLERLYVSWPAVRDRGIHEWLGLTLEQYGDWLDGRLTDAEVLRLIDDAAHAAHEAARRDSGAPTL